MTRIAIRLILILLMLFCSNAYAADLNDSGVNVKWSYKGNNGPERWGQLDSRFTLCAAGKVQSPIDIPRNVTHADYSLKVNYRSENMILEDDGETDLMIGNTQTITNSGHTIQVNFHGKRSNGMIAYAGTDYKLVQFHFHSPSENQWHGRSFPLEIHFVHQGKEGKVAVIGVFVVGGAPNPLLQKIIDHIPTEIDKEFVIPGETMNPTDLFPAKKDYYSFPGSLTTPPCSEGLQWIVMPNPITASPAQILEIRKAIGGNNARSIQPFNRRTITYSVESAA